MSLGSRLSKLRSYVFYSPLYFLATVGWGTVSMVTSRLDPSGRASHKVAQSWARVLCKIIGVQVRTTGLEYLPAGQPYVMACNHLSYMDTPVLFAELPVHFRILARKGLFKIPFLGGHLKRSQHLAVDQGSVQASMRSLIQAAEAVKTGLPLFVFPEAGRAFDGVMKDFMPGAFFVAIHAQAPVVPMVLVGTYELLKPGSGHLRGGKVELIICPPVPTEGLTRREAGKLSVQVREQMLRLYNQHHGDGTPGGDATPVAQVEQTAPTPQ